MSKTQVSYRQGFIKVVWLGRVCMVKVKVGSPHSTQPTTTAPDDGSHFLFFHILVSHMGRYMSYHLSLNDGCMAFGFLTADASAHLSVHSTRMPGVYEWSA